MIFEVVVSHDTACRGLLLVALEYGDQVQEWEDGKVYETNIGRGDGVLFLECPDGLVIPSKFMIGLGGWCASRIEQKKGKINLDQKESSI